LESEVVVFGGTSAGSIAAIQAARMGRRTTLVSFNAHVGGLTFGGLGIARFEIMPGSSP
jgi:pyruvate/2-oxoglutarate dehydrogenase complex dihydrolipoamide dehydrogenase (E3) component